MKAIVISLLLFGCFLLLANLAPSLLSSNRTDNEQACNNREGQVVKSVVSLALLLVALVMVLHYWR